MVGSSWGLGAVLGNTNRTGMRNVISGASVRRFSQMTRRPGQAGNARRPESPGRPSYAETKRTGQSRVATYKVAKVKGRGVVVGMGWLAHTRSGPCTSPNNPTARRTGSQFVQQGRRASKNLAEAGAQAISPLPLAAHPIGWPGGSTGAGRNDEPCQPPVAPAIIN